MYVTSQALPAQRAERLFGERGGDALLWPHRAALFRGIYRTPLECTPTQCIQPSTTLLYTLLVTAPLQFPSLHPYLTTRPITTTSPRAPHHGTFRRCSTRCVGASSFCCAASSYTATQQARLRSRARYSRSEAPPGTIWPPRALSAAARHRPRPRRRPSGSRPVTWSPPFDRVPAPGLQRREVESFRRTGRDPTWTSVKTTL